MITLHKASAGSGKTFSLTYDYIRLLLGVKTYPGGSDTPVWRLRPPGPPAHSHILAITFTNKATDEMKRRIIHELAVLARLEPDWTAPSPYAAGLCSDLNTAPEPLAKAARRALLALLFDYERFNVSTIDSFFQKVLRTFARDVDIQGDYDLELDSRSILRQALAKYLLDSARDDNMEWIIQYMQSKARKGQVWDIYNRASLPFADLADILNHLTGESLHTRRDELLEYLGRPDAIERLNRYNAALQGRVAALTRRASEAAAAVLDLGEPLSSSLNANFSKACRAWLQGMPDRLSKTLASVLADPVAKAFKKGKKGYPVDADSPATAAAVAFASAATAAWKAGITARNASANLFVLGILRDVLRNIDEVTASEGSFLLANTGRLISRIIGDNPVPFIYERTGGYLHHFLIDEFQDTSTLQWQNLHPLLANANASGHDSLIIGDEKQSIYRFRDANPDLIHTRVEADFPDTRPPQRDHAALNTNWRSRRAIVEFNNALYTSMCQGTLGQQQPLVARYFSGHEQLVCPKRAAEEHPGYVRVQPLPPDAFDDSALAVMSAQIYRQLTVQGYRQSQIAILVERHDQAAAVVSHLMALAREPRWQALGLDITTDDALRLTKSPAVNFIVSMMRYLAAPTDDDDDASPAGAGGAAAGYRSVSRSQIAHLAGALRHMRARDPSLTYSRAVLATMARASQPGGGAPPGAPAGAARDLVSLTEHLISLLDRQVLSEQNAYITAFEDLVAERVERGDGDLRAFLEWWDTSGSTTKLKASGEVEAIRVMTIHAAKGLEFACVHLPMLNFSLGPSARGKEWVDNSPARYSGWPGVEAADVPPLLPMTMSKELQESVWSDEYARVAEASAIDRANLLYVATTRAVEELVIQFEQPKSGGSASSLTVGSAVLSPAMAELAANGVAICSDDEEGIGGEVYEVGTPGAPGTRPSEVTALDPDPSLTTLLPPMQPHANPHIWQMLHPESPDSSDDVCT